jgi:hypothetical protein
MDLNQDTVKWWGSVKNDFNSNKERKFVITSPLKNNTYERSLVYGNT